MRKYYRFLLHFPENRGEEGVGVGSNPNIKNVTLFFKAIFIQYGLECISSNERNRELKNEQQQDLR